MTDPARWLDERDPPAPSSVRRVMDELLAETDPATELHRRLADAAMAGLETVVRAPSDRELAPVLLAADALLTYACEAAVEAGLDVLDEVTRELDFERFSHLLPDTP